ncbi:hypothetical protein JYT19_01140 [Sulfobacillus acidophilus]|uniref:Uncharacterized protein n=1 Tax=Sulfobacillus acidophilus TaxID=53633 RepID=A0ABS3AWU0_9FIRM|nr:hypothetical protein [Sulfobacillus acidophilus]
MILNFIFIAATGYFLWSKLAREDKYTLKSHIMDALDTGNTEKLVEMLKEKANIDLSNLTNTVSNSAKSAAKFVVFKLLKETKDQKQKP